jgi:muramoyltetrapeptide carboxypeptidase
VAPGSPFDRTKFQVASDLLERQGYRVSWGANVFESSGYTAGAESARAADLVSALLDPEIAAVICIRGGYGSGCVLPWLPFSRLKDRVKPFVGYSDMTFLHLSFQATSGWTTFHGPNLMDLAENPPSAIALIDSLQGSRDFSFEFTEDQILQGGVASGKLIGGNLTCLVHLMGTPFFPDLEGCLLFIEDCNEQLYRLDRCINQLKLSRVLDRLAGLIMGRFTNCGDENELRAMVFHYTRPIRFPIVAGLPFGHVPENEILPLGIPFLLSTYEHTLRPLTSPFDPVA